MGTTVPLHHLVLSLPLRSGTARRKHIASWGLDHVRIPIDYNVLENEDGSFKESGFSRIDWALEMYRKYSLNTVLDLHKTAGYSFDSYCGEFGVIDVVSPEDTVKWFRTINSVFEKHGIARCAWSAIRRWTSGSPTAVLIR